VQAARTGLGRTMVEVMLRHQGRLAHGRRGHELESRATPAPDEES
jgi:hypothetical protein